MDWRKRMLLTILPLFILCMIISLLVSHTILSTKMTEQSLRDNQNIVEQLKAQISNVYENVELFSKMICTDEEINRLLIAEPDTVSEMTDVRYSLMEALRKYAYLSQYADLFVIHRDDGEIFTSTRGYDEDYRILLQQKWYQDFIAQGRNGSFSQMHTFFTPYGSSNVQGMSYILRYRNPLDKRSGYTYLLAEIQWAQFEKLLGAYHNEYGHIYLLNEQDEPFQGTLPDDVVQSGVLVSGYEESAQGLYVLTRMEKPGWSLLLTLDRAGLNREILHELYRYALIQCLVFTALILVATGFIFKKSKPIRVLDKAVRAIAKGELSTRVSLQTGDELEQLGNNINEMAASLQKQLDAIVSAEEEKQRLQSGLLMAQIRPHFIYNTLNSVVYLIEEGRSSEAIGSTNALIALLQDTVHFSKVDAMTTVEAEMRNVQHYLTIQSIRYPDCFTYEPAAEENVRQWLLPRMILQPLVENALLHGIVPTGRPCTLRLTARIEADRLCLTVEDDGAGMTAEQLATCLDYRESNGMRGIALSNIIERLQLVYGQDSFLFDINAMPDQGTAVEIRLPLRHEEGGKAHG